MLMMILDERLSREQMLLGACAVRRLKESRVAVFGLGGVGSWCAEALARAGVGELLLVDSDSYSVTNINRQLYALDSTVGKEKTGVAAERIREINPEIKVTPVTEIYSEKTRDLFFSSGKDYDYVADAIDLVSCKLDLILTCRENGIPIVSALGTGNKKDLQQLRIGDISETYGCALARVMRKELRARGVEHLNVVFSPEEPLPAEQFEAPPPGRRSVPGSLVWVPAAAGLLMCQKIVADLTGI